MAKTPVPEKMISLSDLYLKRMDQRLKEENPEVAVFWASMIHSLFALAGKMSADGQMHPEAFSELNKREQRALNVLQHIGPFGLSGKDPSVAETVLSAYGAFREEAEGLGVV